MICHSKNVLTQIKKTLFNYDLQIERVKSEIEYRKETMDFLACETNKSKVKQFYQSKIEKENYEVYLSRLLLQRTSLIRRLNIAVSKYFDGYGDLFVDYFINCLPLNELTNKYNLEENAVSNIINKIQNNLIEL